ncbi:hypothetical protein BKA03_000999 [Demequina lutea]|uniref:Uncharacterized protein n=1 Tax=Demequina lutea TaxID=431489 RepID=A0A7Y9Z9T9_9MICO|nr:hypothetical protein [Demequina lutea]
MRTYPYHSRNPDDPDVYHNHNDCPEGEKIPAGQRANGTNDYSQCEQCKDKG